MFQSNESAEVCGDTRGLRNRTKNEKEYITPFGCTPKQHILAQYEMAPKALCLEWPKKERSKGKS